MPRLVIVLLFTLSVTACAMQPPPEATDLGQTTSEDVGNMVGTASTWTPIYSIPRAF